MIAKIVFFSAVTAATLVVILLALVSPSPHRKSDSLAISLYVQPPHPRSPPHHNASHLHASKAFIFHHSLTEGPHNTSRIIGKAQGLVLPAKHLALAAFNMVYLTFDTPEHRGSLGIEANARWHGTSEELAVVGGTGSFAFARGAAIFVQTSAQRSDAAAAMYQIKLRLSLPERSRAIPG